MFPTEDPTSTVTKGRSPAAGMVWRRSWSKGVIHPELRLVIFPAETSEVVDLTAGKIYVRTYVDRHEEYRMVSTMIWLMGNQSNNMIIARASPLPAKTGSN